MTRSARGSRTLTAVGVVLALFGLFGVAGTAVSSAAPVRSPSDAAAAAASISGVGTSVGTPALGAWGNTLSQAHPPEQVSYIGGGITNAEPAFVDNDFSVDGGPDFLSDEDPLDASSAQQLAAKKQKVAAAPVALSGLTFMFALRMQKCVRHQPSGIPDTQVTELTLTPNLLAGMFLGQTILNHGTVSEFHLAVPNWNLPAILALNPGLSASCTGRNADALAGAYGEQIFPVGRQDAVPENQALAGFFAQAAPTVWQLYLQLIGDTSYTPSDQFPWDANSLTSNGYLAQDESAQVQDLLGGNNDSYPSPFYQTVTYLGSGDVAGQVAKFSAAGLTPAFVNLVPNAVTSLPQSGVTPIGPTVSAVAAEGAHIKATTDGWYQSDESFTDPAAWPVPMLTSLVVPTSHLTRDSAASLAALIGYASSATGQQGLSAVAWSPPGDTTDQYGFTPLTGSLSTFAAAAQDVAGVVAKEGVTIPPPTTTTTTVPPGPTTTVATPAPSGSGQPPAGTGSGLTPASGSGPGGGTGSPTRVAAAASTGTAVPPNRSSGGSSVRPAPPVTIPFLVTGAPLHDHPGHSLTGATFGAAAPWLLLLGLLIAGTGWRSRRRALA